MRTLHGGYPARQAAIFFEEGALDLEIVVAFENSIENLFISRRDDC
jgi:hypothetical protein